MVRLAGLKENTLLFGGFSGSEVDALCFNTSRYSSCVLPGLRGEQIFFPACHRVSPRQKPPKNKRALLKRHVLPPRHASCQLNAVTSHHSGGLVHRIQQSA